jgi:hypothetical protein
MAKFFDYIFYSVYKAYVNWGEKDIPSVYALGVLTLFQFFSLFGVSGVLIKLAESNFRFQNQAIIISILILLGFNYIRIFKVIGKTEIVELWDNVPSYTKGRMRILMVALSVFVLSLSIAAILI